jgi:hypothetical protein
LDECNPTTSGLNSLKIQHTMKQNRGTRMQKLLPVTIFQTVRCSGRRNKDNKGIQYIHTIRKKKRLKVMFTCRLAAYTFICIGYCIEHKSSVRECNCKEDDI